jgi:hypothetical protein
VLLLVRLPLHPDGAGRCQRGSLVAAAALQQGHNQVSPSCDTACCKDIVHIPDQKSVSLLQFCMSDIGRVAWQT